MHIPLSQPGVPPEARPLTILLAEPYVSKAHNSSHSERGPVLQSIINTTESNEVFEC